MKNLSKILALSMAMLMLMCMSLTPVRAFAAEDDPPNNNTGTVEVTPDPTNPTVVPDNQPVTPDPEPEPEPKWEPDWEEDYYEEEVKEEPKEEPKEEKVEEIILKIILTVGSKDLEKYLNEDKTIIKMDIAPYIKDGRTMIPIRYLAEALEMKVTWDKETRTVLLEDAKFKIEIPVDTNIIKVNGEETESDVKPELKEGRTMLAIANVARALGLKDGEDIFWDPVEKKVTIKRKLTT